MKTYALFLVIKKLHKILSKKDFSIILINIFDDISRKAIVLSPGMILKDGEYNKEYAKAISLACIYYGFYYEVFLLV